MWVGTTLSKRFCTHGAVFVGTREFVERSRAAHALRGSAAGSPISAAVGEPVLRYVREHTERCEIEARILIPVLDALGEELGRERVLETAARAIREVAREQGRQLAEAMGGDSLAHLAASLDDWKSDGALEIEVREESDERFAFDVNRCRYAEMYRALGRPDLGDTFSCGRDFALCEGFNPRMRLPRTQTIMEGASHCDFRFELRREPEE